MPIVSQQASRVLLAILVVVLLRIPAAHAQPTAQPKGPTFEKEVVAVLDLNVSGAGAPLALAASIRLREELLRSGYFQLVDRQRLNRVLEEQALSQASCLGTDCTIEVGRITGARIIMTGDLIQLSEGTWQISALMTDVETAEVLRAGSVYFEGSPRDVLNEGVSRLVDNLVPQGDPATYGGVVNFLTQTSSDIMKGAASGLLGVEPDERTGELRMQEGSNFRVWASPISYFRYGIRNDNNHHLEYLLGKGISVGVERELDKSWALGGSMHTGALRERKLDSGATSLILGYYTAWSLYALDAVPNGHPWFYYGTGLFNYYLNYTDAGENLVAGGIGALLMLRFMYAFDAEGPVIGAGMESNYLFSVQSRGTRLDQYKATGVNVSDHPWGMVAYSFVGYTF